MKWINSIFWAVFTFLFISSTEKLVSPALVTEMTVWEGVVVSPLTKAFEKVEKKEEDGEEEEEEAEVDLPEESQLEGQ